MRLIIKLIFTILALLFVGCGGDSTQSSTNSSIAVASCSLSIESWTTVGSGDTVSADAGAQLQFDHDSSGNKKVCVVTGNAQIL